MLLEVLLYLFLEIQKKVWVFFNIFLPFWTFEVFADSDNIFKEFLSKIFWDFLHQPCRNIRNFCIYVHTYVNDSNIFFNGSVSDDEIFVIELDIIGIHLHWKLKNILKIWFIMNRSSEKENLFVGVVKSTVSDSLEKRLSCGEQRDVILCIADSTVSGYLFLLSRNFYEWSIIFI